MATLKQVLANRKNAEKSTGPTSAEGKAVVAQNAAKHRVFCEGLLVEGDDPAELQQLPDGMLADIGPRSFSERLLAERIIAASWRLRRLIQAEQHLHQSIGDVERKDLGEHGQYPGEEADIREYERTKGRLNREASWDRIKQRRIDWASEQLCPGGLTLAIDLSNENSQIERYSRYEKRLEGTIHRAWRELRLLRKDAENHPPSPLVGEGGGEGEAVQTSHVDVRSLESAPSSPHPDPLPQGEREPEEKMQNKPNSSGTDGPAEVYAEASSPEITMPLPRVILRPLPGHFLDDGDDGMR